MVSLRPRRDLASLATPSAGRDSSCGESITDRTDSGCGIDHFAGDRATWSRNRVGCWRCIRRRRSSVVPERVEGRLGRELLRNDSQVGRTDSWVGTNHSLEVPCIPAEPRTPSSRCPTERSRSAGSSSSEAERHSFRSRSLGLHRSIVRNSSRRHRADHSSSYSRSEADCTRRSHNRAERHSRRYGSSNRLDRRARQSAVAGYIVPCRVRPRSLEREQSQPTATSRRLLTTVW